MGPLHHVGAAAPGQVTPRSDKADGANVGQVGEQSSRENPDSQAAPLAGQALKVIQGESKAAEFVSRLHAQQADPDELALIGSMMYGSVLRGFCRAIAKALGVQHG